MSDQEDNWSAVRLLLLILLIPTIMVMSALAHCDACTCGNGDMIRHTIQQIGK